MLLRHFLSFPVQRPYSAMGCRCPALLRGGRRCPRRVRRVGLHCRQHGGKPAHRPRTGAANARGWVCAVRGCGQRVQRKGLLCRSRHSGRTPGRPGKRFIEVFAGRKGSGGRLTSAAQAGGFDALPAVRSGLPRGLRQLERNADMACWIHLAPPCRVWSRARTTAPSRYEDQAADLPMLRLAARLARRVDSRGGAFTLEHPQTSAAWATRPWRRLAHRAGVRKVHLHQCRFGLRVCGRLRKKATTLLTNRPLAGMQRTAHFE